MDESQNNTMHEARQAQMSALSAMPDFYMRNMQRTSAKMLRAQERMMHGLMQAAQLQMKFSQDFWATRTAGARADAPAEAGSMAVAETERMLALLREVTGTMQRGFTEAMQLLMDNAETMAQDARDTGTDAVEDAAQAARASVGAAHETLSKTGEALRDGAASLTPPTAASTRRAPGAGN